MSYWKAAGAPAAAHKQAILHVQRRNMHAPRAHNNISCLVGV
jgi:hypothetical protein